MSTYRRLFNEDYTDVVRKKIRVTKGNPLTYFERFLRAYNGRFHRYLTITDYEFWMFSKLAYSNDGVDQEFIDRKYNIRYEIKDFITKSDGLQLYLIESRLTKDVIIAFRGTDEWIDWLTNLQILRGKKRQFETAIEYIEVILKEYQGYRVSLCGHSLGGALAQYLYVHFHEREEVQFVKAVTFNSAGVRYEDEHPHYDLPIYNYVIEKDIVGNTTGFHFGRVYLCRMNEPDRKRVPLNLFTHTLDQFTFDGKGKIETLRQNLLASEG